MSLPPTKLICFDCDSTLSAIEGVDEMARLRGAECFRRVEQMTNDAMEGRIALDDIFRLRLELIQPTREETAAIGQLYLKTIEPTARETVQALHAAGWTTAIISGGYTQAIEPLAEFLGIDRIEAVRLKFTPEGRYAGFDASHPAARRGGKLDLVRALRDEFKADRAVLVGDGVSDLEASAGVDVFVGFGRYAQRARVKAEAHHFVTALSELPALLAS